MTTISNATLSVPGADLYYEVRGTGPVLLISQSGEGDARRSEGLVRQLEQTYTVITYDRRGLSRSTIHDTTEPVTVAKHADDVHRLLTALTDQPAHMLGCSMGAAIGLHLAVEHPEQLHTLIAHEPVTPWLLAAAERAHHLRELEHCQQVFRDSGWQAALAPMVKTLGIDPRNQELEPGVELPRLLQRVPRTSHSLSARTSPPFAPTTSMPPNCSGQPSTSFRLPGVAPRMRFSTTNARRSWPCCVIPRWSNSPVATTAI